MAETKGLLVEIGADTSKMNKALNRLNAPLKKIQSELKFIDKALKLNPKNVELLRQKMKLMQQAIKESQSNTARLKAELARLRANNAPEEQIRRLEREIILAEAETKKLRKEFALFQASQSTLGKLGTTLSNLGSKLTNAGNAMRTFSMYSGMATAGLVAFGYKAVQHADDLNTLAKQSGVATDSLQKFAGASNLVDVSTEAMAKGQAKVVKAMKSGSDVFEKYGIEVKNADGTMRDSQDVFYDFMDAMGEIDNKTERAAAMQELFGAKAYQALMPLAGNVDIIREYGDRFEELGLILDQKTLDRMNALNDQIDYLRAVGAMAFYKIGGAISKAFEGFGGIDQVIANIADYIDKLNPKITRMVIAFGAVSTIVAPLLIFFGALSSSIGVLASNLAKVLTPLRSVFGMFGTGAGAITRLLGPIGLAISAFTLLWKNSEEFREAIQELVQVLGGSLMQIFNAMKPLLPVLAVLLSQLATIIGTVLGTAIKAVIPAITRLLSVFTTVSTAIIGVVTRLASSVSSKFNAIKTKMVTPINSARDLIKKAVNKIKSFFPLKIGKIFSGMKLPHFNVSGGKAPFGIGGKGSRPSISVKWYKTGGIFDGTTVQALGWGEKAPEAIIPLSGREMQPFAAAIADNFNNIIDYGMLANAIITGLAGASSPIVIQIDGKTVADTTAPYMNTAINQIQARQARQLGLVGV